MKHIGLFEGIGGFSLAARKMGWDTIAWCEINPFCQKVLSYHFPEATPHHDITTTDFTIYRGQCNILTGGFPCQPYSVAGKRLGKEDDRHLWPQMLRAIREIQPAFVVGENVGGLISWNGGLVFHEVQADLEAEGYEVQSFILPACGVDAPHRRDRVWIVAHANNYGLYGSKNGQGLGKGNDSNEARSKQTEQFTRRSFKDAWPTPNTNNQECNRWSSTSERKWQKAEQRRDGVFGSAARFSKIGLTPDANSIQRCERGLYKAKQQTSERYISSLNTRNTWNTWQNFPTQSPICSGDDGLPSRLDGITFSKWRNESIKAYGNAIVHQIALRIFQAIELSR